jgi:hypothetical protein
MENSLYFVETTASPALIDGSRIQLQVIAPHGACDSGQARPSDFSSIVNKPESTTSYPAGRAVGSADFLLVPFVCAV